jgi:predicted nucleic acid-binding Zn ribbon protein
MKRKDPETLADVLQQYLKAIGADKHIKEMRMMQKWDEIVGPYIARDTLDFSLKDGTLTVKFRTPIIRNEISMRRTILLQRLNEAAGEEIINKIEVK